MRHCERSAAIPVTRAPKERVVISRDPFVALGTPAAECFVTLFLAMNKSEFP